MKVRKILMLMILSVFSLCAFNKGYAQELLNEEQIIETVFEKIYVFPDQILIYSEGIFYLNEAGDVTPVRLISTDASGLYIVKLSRPRCHVCNTVLDRGVCRKEGCRMNGK